ncbi:MAG: helix-turn-helix domain-containing protein [Candidatus Thiodiazotropha sp. (ex Lucinoma borealis)]|nr:helix-turn-helix domain-containing protein [Candidatus Thiodiazotropha sp. (ex Lucinoma borealis)]
MSGAKCEKDTNVIKESALSGAQRQKILKHLQEGKYLTILFVREMLGIMHPAMRFKELRHKGYNIITYWWAEIDVTGTHHRIARCFLKAGKKEGVA